MFLPQTYQNQFFLLKNRAVPQTHPRIMVNVQHSVEKVGTKCHPRIFECSPIVHRYLAVNSETECWTVEPECWTVEPECWTVAKLNNWECWTRVFLQNAEQFSQNVEQLQNAEQWSQLSRECWTVEPECWTAARMLNSSQECWTVAMLNNWNAEQWSECERIFNFLNK